MSFVFPEARDDFTESFLLIQVIGIAFYSVLVAKYTHT